MMCRKIRHINIKQRSQAVEIRMFYALILLSIANFLFAVYLITWDILSRRHNELAPIAEWTLYIIIDFYDMNSPYGLLITSKVVRKNFCSREYLATQKKVQQLLAKPGMIERFLPEDPSMVTMLRSTFAGLWSLNDTDERCQNAIKDAIEHPENYVIKPNMEGGGHNFFGQQVREKLLTFTADEREAHILMQKLNPMIVKNYMIRSLKEPVFGEMTTELGIFGFLLGDSRDKTVAYNVQKGHFMRTKLASVNEGGVSIGTGVFDSPYLIPIP
uniref:Glutathione synthase n=1 Tax=Globodera pallida TaxID=36090 RepID=A0A183BRL7_GLOPA